MDEGHLLCAILVVQLPRATEPEHLGAGAIPRDLCRFGIAMIIVDLADRVRQDHIDSIAAEKVCTFAPLFDL